MEDILKQVIDKISSYNILNYLYPGILFCYLLGVLFDVDVLSDNWVDNLIICYFVGMVLSRIGSVIIEPIMKKIKVRKQQLLKYVPYADYEKASSIEPMVATLSEVNNTYRTLLACFVCLLGYKICIAINKMCVKINITFFQDNKDWLLLVFLIMLFTCSYIKQTSYVRERVKSVLKRRSTLE